MKIRGIPYDEIFKQIDLKEIAEEAVEAHLQSFSDTKLDLDPEAVTILATVVTGILAGKITAAEIEGLPNVARRLWAQTIPAKFIEAAYKAKAPDTTPGL